MSFKSRFRFLVKEFSSFKKSINFPKSAFVQKTTRYVKRFDKFFLSEFIFSICIWLVDQLKINKIEFFTVFSNAKYDVFLRFVPLTFSRGNFSICGRFQFSSFSICIFFTSYKRYICSRKNWIRSSYSRWSFFCRCFCKKNFLSPRNVFSSLVFLLYFFFCIFN